jgi:hypothetical protein
VSVGILVLGRRRGRPQAGARADLARGAGGELRDVEQRLHVFARVGEGDEDEARAPVVARPSVQPRDLVQQHLRAVQHGRRVGALGDGDDALDAKQVRPDVLRERDDEQAQGILRQRLVAHDTEGDARSCRGSLRLADRGGAARVAIPLEPRLDAGRGARAVERRGAEHRFHGRRRRHVDHVRGGVDRREPLAQCRRASRGRRRRTREVELGEHDAIGDGRLLERLDVRLQRDQPVHRIDQRDDVAERVARAQRGLGEQRLDHRAGVREPRRLDHHAGERGQRPAGAPPVEIVERAHEVAAHRTAQAAVGKQDDGVVAGGDEVVVEADLPELVDDHGRVRHAGLREQPVDQRGLAAAEEAGDECDLGSRHGVFVSILEASGGPGGRA